MTDDDFDVRLGQVERAIAVISTIENNPDLQAAAFSHLFGTAPLLRGDAFEEAPPADDSTVDETGDTPRKATGGGGGKRPRKVASVSADKSVNLTPNGKVSWADFVAEKMPKTTNERYSCCIHWLLEEAGLTAATINQVVYLYIAAKWTLPNNPRNAASQTSRQGYIDSKDQSNLTITSSGTALVLNDLPSK